MSLKDLYQDNGQIEMATSAITFGILKQNTQEQQSIVNGEMHDTNILFTFNAFLLLFNSRWVVVI